MEAPLICPLMGVSSSIIHDMMVHVKLAMKDLSMPGWLVFPAMDTGSKDCAANLDCRLAAWLATALPGAHQMEQVGCLGQTIGCTICRSTITWQSALLSFPNCRKVEKCWWLASQLLGGGWEERGGEVLGTGVLAWAPRGDVVQFLPCLLKATFC